MRAKRVPTVRMRSEIYEMMMRDRRKAYGVTPCRLADLLPPFIEIAWEGNGANARGENYIGTRGGPDC